MGTVQQYLYNWMVMISQAISVVLGGHPDESISQRTARAAKNKPGSYWRFQMIAIDTFVELITGEKDHCMRSIEGESNCRAIWDWSK